MYFKLYILNRDIMIMIPLFNKELILLLLTIHLQLVNFYSFIILWIFIQFMLFIVSLLHVITEL